MARPAPYPVRDKIRDGLTSFFMQLFGLRLSHRRTPNDHIPSKKYNSLLPHRVYNLPTHRKRMRTHTDLPHSRSYYRFTPSNFSTVTPTKLRRRLRRQVHEWHTWNWAESGIFCLAPSPYVSSTTYQISSLETTHHTSHDQQRTIDESHQRPVSPDAISDSLIDRGANGGLGGADVCFLGQSGDRFCDITGIDNHKLNKLPVGTCTAWTNSINRGPCILMMHQYAYSGKGKTIHAPIQLEDYGNIVLDKACRYGGDQLLRTLDGWILPISIKSGLPYIEMRPNTPEELHSLPTVVLTSDMIWHPDRADLYFEDDQWQQQFSLKYGSLANDDYGDSRFTYDGDYILHTHAHSFLDDPLVPSDISECDSLLTQYQQHVIPDFTFDSAPYTHIVCNSKITPHARDYDAYRSRFGWLTTETIKRTFDKTTQWAQHQYNIPFRRHYKSRFPAHNVSRRNEPVATDCIFVGVSAIGCGSTMAQIFVGRNTLVTDVYGSKSDGDFSSKLEENIRRRGAMDKLISDKAKSETSKRVLDILRSMFIQDWQSEPHHQWQNFAENRWQTVQNMANNILSRTGAPDSSWLLCLQWICYILNHSATKALDWDVPLTRLTGQTVDISPLMQFTFWEPVYYATHDTTKTFPSHCNEARGHFVGISEHCGDILTYLIYNPDTNRLLHRSDVRSALVPGEENLRLSPKQGEWLPTHPIRNVIQSGTQLDNGLSGTPTSMHTIDPNTFLGRSFLLPRNDDGTRHEAIVQRIIADDHSCATNRLKFTIKSTHDDHEEIISYNDLLSHFENQLSSGDPDEVYTFQEIIGHRGPLRKGRDNDYKGSMWNVQVLWTNGDVTFEPLHIIGKDAPIIVAQYARQHNLYELPGWKRFKYLATRSNKIFIRMLRQVHLQRQNNAIKYQYGYRVPRSEYEALELDKSAGNTKWYDAMKLELKCLDEYKTFRDLGKNSSPPPGSLKIRCHWVFAIKHDGRHRARLVAGGHLTPKPVDSVYSSVVSLRGIRLVVFLAELNGLKLFGADIGSAYLEAYTTEKVHIIGSPIFGECHGHTLVIEKALYGLKSSGARWHERLADVFRTMGFVPCKMEPDIWMRKHNNTYEYIATYVDDLCIAAHDPARIIDELKTKHKFKIKGDGALEFHLGCNFGRDKDGVFWFGPHQYVDRMHEAYQRMFGSKVETKGKRGTWSPLVSGDHPELDESGPLDDDDTAKYLSMIGSLQWLISLGRFDIACAVSTMSRFRLAPRVGHLERVKRIYRYVITTRQAAIRVRTGKPSHDVFNSTWKQYDWAHSIYGNVTEDIPKDIPAPLGHSVNTTTYVDANLLHDLSTGRSCTGILHFINGMPVEWFSKRQRSVQSATYGSEFVAARIATDHIMDLRTTLRYLGVPIERSYMFGDNESVVKSSTILDSVLSKRHNALSFHRVREAIASDLLRFFYMKGTTNPADCLTKHAGCQEFMPTLRPLLFWQGDPISAPLPQPSLPTQVRFARIEV